MWSLNAQTARRSGLDHASMMLAARQPDRTMLLFIDAQSDEVFALDIEALERETQALALSPRGDRILLSRRVPRSPETLLVCRDLASGRERVYDGLFQVVSAAFSPDGGAAAVATAGLDGPVTLIVFDLDSGARRVLPLADHLAGLQTAVTWSPDGTALAVGGYSPDDEEMVVFVDDQDGCLVAAYPGACLVDSSNGMWLDASRLVLVGDDSAPGGTGRFGVADFRDGSYTAFDDRPLPGLLEAVIGDTLVWSTRLATGEMNAIEVTAMDGSGQRAVAVVDPPLSRRRLEVAPALLSAALDRVRSLADRGPAR
jgi:hypothetical protein